MNLTEGIRPFAENSDIRRSGRRRPRSDPGKHTIGAKQEVATRPDHPSRRSRGDRLSRGIRTRI